MTDGVRIPARRKLLYLGILLFLLLAVCEGGLRLRAWVKYGSAASGLRDPMTVRDEQAGIWVPKPNYEIKGANIHIKINSLGFRGDDFSVAKPAGTFRIVCLGASTTFSSEVSSNAATWPHRLQEKLRAAYPGRHIEVLNAALGGYVAEDNLKNLQHRVLQLNPDLVIYYEANNEIVKDTRDLAAREGIIGANEGRQSAWSAALSRASLLFDLAYKNLAIVARSRSGNERRLDRVPAELPAHFIGVLDQMRQELAARNTRFLLSTFLVKYRRDQDHRTQVANADVAFYYMPWMSIEGMLDAMDVYNSAILDYGRRMGVPVVDDRTAIPADAKHFTDCMHLSDQGNEAMADRFLRFIQADTAALGLVTPGR